MRAFLYRCANRRQRPHRNFARDRAPRPLILVDFHCHTTKSDGSLEPQALADLMQRRGVVAFSITDHDTVAAYGSFSAPSATRVFTGIEINASYADSEVHILGFGVPSDAPGLNAMIERNRGARRVRVANIVEQLRAAGYDLDMDAVEAEAMPGASLGRPHVGKALIRKGIAPDIETAFASFLRRGSPGYVPATHITPHEAIEIVLQCGGVPVLAHPGRLRDYGIIGELAAHGLRGLEVFYPRHEPSQISHFRESAKRYNLVMSGGSDFHDIRYNTRGVGMEVEAADIAPFLDCLSA